MGLSSAKGFQGGTHPPENKERTKGKPIEELPLPPKVIIPLQQRVGPGAEPLVAKGDMVLTGQKIGEAKSPFSSHVHASISGKVTQIVDYPHPQGLNAKSILIESDGADKHVESLQENPEYLKLSPQQINQIVREAGIVGMGGAEFPTNIKLSPPKDKKIECVILNGAECEPYLTSDHRLMLEHGREIVEGLKILIRQVSADKGVIGIEKNKKDAVLNLKKLVAGTGIEVKELSVKYPQGGEKMLIKTLLGREVKAGGLPMDEGVLVQNVGTAKSIYEAVRFGQPLIQRVVTVTGVDVREPKNLLVRIGTPIQILIDHCGVDGQPEQVIMGGPMMGQAQFTLAVPVIKGTSGIVLQSVKEYVKRTLNPCIRCGRCMNSCPLGLSPSLFGIYGERRIFEKAEIMGVKECMECGVCTYVCPARRPISQFIKSIKSELNNRKNKKMGRR